MCAGLGGCEQDVMGVSRSGWVRAGLGGCEQVWVGVSRSAWM